MITKWSFMAHLQNFSCYHFGRAVFPPQNQFSASELQNSETTTLKLGDFSSFINSRKFEIGGYPRYQLASALKTRVDRLHLQQVKTSFI